MGEYESKSWKTYADLMKENYILLREFMYKKSFIRKIHHIFILRSD
jgi:hypothetical protein